MLEIHAIKENLFPGAWDAVGQAFPWHKGAASPHSSQALAVSVFGTIAVHPLRQVLINEALNLVFGWDYPGDSDWNVSLEKKLPTNLLGERRPTEVDVLLQNESGVVFLESKFTEAGGGPCSQPQPLTSGRHKGLIQCDGNYRVQVNPVNKKTARCALSAKGIQYWPYLPAYFHLDNGQDYVPCPFAGSAYQYMRNVLAAGQWARRNRLERSAFALVYVAGDAYPVSNEVADSRSAWGQFVARLRSDASVTVRGVPYQRLLESWRQVLPNDQILADLAHWVTGRFHAVEQTI